MYCSLRPLSSHLLDGLLELHPINLHQKDTAGSGYGFGSPSSGRSFSQARSRDPARDWDATSDARSGLQRMESSWSGLGRHRQRITEEDLFGVR